MVAREQFKVVIYTLMHPAIALIFGLRSVD